MALNTAQFDALFVNAFGGAPAEFGIETDGSAPDAIGRAGEHTVELFIVQQRAIEWRVDGAPLVAWKQYPKDDPGRLQNAAALRATLV